ncbi:KWG leptospira [Clostridium tepidiprofundi DSM 19306]|uniref:KWG leptospira n=1 Tax=Clostridium tepidiprofundi DSM 19306 TaxID=1121338 RepID=A0A151B4Y8_9CLOT|nr:WG repeat-containing protein [Clostridium tepidiprofundi]KYH34981.1 KWG leptospira [Clostridium tepidiprofundi DSM 19306]
MSINKKIITLILIFVLLCIVGLRVVIISSKNSKNIKPIEDGELYIISKGGNGTYTDGLVRYGFMNKNGQVVIEPKYKRVSSFINGVAYVKDNNDNGYLIDKNENKISRVEGRYVEVYDGLWLMRIDNKWGYIDKTGKWVIEPKYGFTYGFREGLAAVRENGKWGFVDKNGKWIIKPTFQKIQSFSEGLAAVWVNAKCGFINKSGKWIIRPTFEDAEKFSQGLAAVKLKGKWGYVDKSGKWVIKPSFQKASIFKEGYSIVGEYDSNNNLKEGIIDKKGHFIIGTKYDEIYFDGFDKSGFIFRQKKLYGVVSLTGEVTIEPKYTLFIWHSNHKIFMDRDTIYFLDESLNIKHKYKLGKVFPLNYDNKLISIMTKSGIWYFSKDGKLIKKMDADFSKGFEKIDGIN